jgi:hypothetical protein
MEIVPELQASRRRRYRQPVAMLERTTPLKMIRIVISIQMNPPSSLRTISMRSPRKE